MLSKAKHVVVGKEDGQNVAKYAGLCSSGRNLRCWLGFHFISFVGWGLFVIVFLSGRIDCNFDSNFSAIYDLAIHLSASLLLQLLGRQSDEAKTTSLAS